jgi:hypothetical protein
MALPEELREKSGYARERLIQGQFTLRRWVALLVKIGPDKAEAEGFGGSNVEADDAAWPDFRRSRRDGANFPYLFVHRR